MKMRIKLIGIVLLATKILSNKCLESPPALTDWVEVCPTSSSVLFDDLTISSFIDDNRYIRLNISWEKPLANFSYFDMDIDTNCSALYGDRNISVNKHYVVQPDMERLKHPAEPLLHGCQYYFELTTEAVVENKTCLLLESADYVIPDCLGRVCACNVARSPFEFSSYKALPNGTYGISFKKNEEQSGLSLEDVLDKVWFTSTSFHKTVTILHPDHIIFDNQTTTVYLSFPEFLAGYEYLVSIELMLDSCEYHTQLTIQVPKGPEVTKSSVHKGIVYIGLIFAVLFTVLFVTVKKKPRLLEKLNRYFPFLATSRQDVIHQAVATETMSLRKEVINAQYTPLEFIENLHKFDKFEIPRNKIILKNEIGGGAFGKVFKADVYGLVDESEFCKVAVKKPFEHSSAEEIADFLAEIAVMKKIGECGSHPNVMQLLACVTVDAPYMMIMELVPCGSLKTYLTDLRKQWKESKKYTENNRRFFPDNMVVENYLPVSISEAEKLKYTNLIFDDYTESAGSSETNSYISPETPKTPNSPVTPPVTPRTKKAPDRTVLKPLKHGVINKISLITPTCFAPGSPLTPNSNTSGGLPSATETLLTSLESFPATPPPQTPTEKHDQLKPMLDSRELCSFALQIANGMAFLENIDITHRDLAARNILITEDKVLKISDFGMARSGVYVNSVHKRQPLRWMAPEAIESRTCNNKTDVWSFGVVLWEIASLGAFPYKKLTNDQVIAHVLQGKRLERPDMCTDQLYSVMLQCWQKNPDDRPRFTDLSRQLDAASAKFYVDLSKIPLSGPSDDSPV